VRVNFGYPHIVPLDWDSFRLACTAYALCLTRLICLLDECLMLDIVTCCIYISPLPLCYFNAILMYYFVLICHLLSTL